MKIARYWGVLRSLFVYYRPTKYSQWHKFYKSILTEGSTVFDIGAHVGSKTRSMRKAGAKVIALEPQQPFAGFLRRTLPKDIVLIEAAAGEHETKAEMSVSTKHPTVSSLRTDFVSKGTSTPGFQHVRWDKKQTVQVVTLDGLIKKHGKPDYIKIDVEGFELEVLKGLSQPIALISFEFLPGFLNLSLAVIERLNQLGDYEFNILIGEKTQFLFSEWSDQKSLVAWMQNQNPRSKSADIFARFKAN